MYLRLSSEIQGRVTKTQEIPLHFRHRLLDGYKTLYWKATEFNLLTQYYDHKEVDIYIHTIQANKIIRLFSSTSVERYVIGWLRKGKATLCEYNGSTMELTAPIILYFRTSIGKEISIDFPTGQHELIFCCLTVNFESVLNEWYPTMALSEMPLKLWHPTNLTQNQWEELFSGEIPRDLYGCFVAERIRTFLRTLMTKFISDEQIAIWRKNHPGISTTVIEKAYLAKKYIDDQNGQPITLNQLSRKIGWNLSGLKRGFVETYGITPRRYIIKKRMDKAISLIKETKLPIYSIAQICGYQHSNQLIRQYKQAYGKTPGEMRKFKLTKS